MDDAETKNRRARLRELIAVCFNDKDVELLDYIEQRTKKRPNQGELSAIQVDDGGKSFGDKKAKTLTEQIGLHRRWFDMPLGTALNRNEWLYSKDSNIKALFAAEPHRKYAALPGSVIQSHANNNSNVVIGPKIRGKVPVISWTKAGEMVEAVDIFAPGYADDWIDTTAPVRAHTYALVVTGDSMEPEFTEGMIVVVEPDIQPEPKKYVIARKNGNATLKQLVAVGGEWFLKPLNERYPIMQLTEEFEIIGVVVQAIKNFR